MNNIFSFKRTIRIIRKDMFSEYKNLLIWIVSSAGVMITISALSMLFQKYFGFAPIFAKYFHYVIYIILLFLGGFLVTSSMFKDLHDKSKNIYWLTLPGSTLEKVISRILISSILFVFLLTTLYPLFATLSELFNQMLFGSRHEFFNPFTKKVLKLIPYFFVIQSIFFAGACTFRKHPFAKTLLSIALILIIISLIFSLLYRVLIGGSVVEIDEISKFQKNFAKILFWGGVAPFFYVFSYFKLSEKEVRDGL